MVTLRRALIASAVGLMAAVSAVGATTIASAGTTDAAGSTAVAATVPHTVTFVNNSGKKLWIGSVANPNEPDGQSVTLTGLPILEAGQSATVTIPEDKAPGHWRGHFFARSGCSGTVGSTFHCVVGDCGPYAQRCSLGEQPVSLAEVNFDTKDSLGPWYDVSYVNGYSLSITIAPKGAANPTSNGPCSTQGCTEDLLPYCPQANRVNNPAGKLVLCVNPNRDAQTNYSNAITTHCPKAYAWSKQDAVAGNQVVRQCTSCNGFTVTFR